MEQSLLLARCKKIESLMSCDENDEVRQVEDIDKKGRLAVFSAYIRQIENVEPSALRGMHFCLGYLQKSLEQAPDNFASDGVFKLLWPLTCSLQCWAFKKICIYVELDHSKLNSKIQEEIRIKRDDLLRLQSFVVFVIMDIQTCPELNGIFVQVEYESQSDRLLILMLPDRRIKVKDGDELVCKNSLYSKVLIIENFSSKNEIFYNDFIIQGFSQENFPDSAYLTCVKLLSYFGSNDGCFSVYRNKLTNELRKQKQERILFSSYAKSVRIININKSEVNSIEKCLSNVNDGTRKVSESVYYKLKSAPLFEPLESFANKTELLYVGELATELHTTLKKLNALNSVLFTKVSVEHFSVLYAFNECRLLAFDLRSEISRHPEMLSVGILEWASVCLRFLVFPFKAFNTDYSLKGVANTVGFNESFKVHLLEKIESALIKAGVNRLVKIELESKDDYEVIRSLSNTFYNMYESELQELDYSVLIDADIYDNIVRSVLEYIRIEITKRGQASVQYVKDCFRLLIFATVQENMFYGLCQQTAWELLKLLHNLQQIRPSNENNRKALASLVGAMANSIVRSSKIS